MNWQPIDTAPKDGTDVLVLLDCAGVAVVHIAWWRSREEWESSGQYCGGWDSVEDWEGWWSYTQGSVTQERLEGWRQPTHWTPLPTMTTTVALDADLAAACREWVKGCSCAPADQPQQCQECTTAFLNAVLGRAKKHGLQIGANAIT